MPPPISRSTARISTCPEFGVFGPRALLGMPGPLRCGALTQLDRCGQMEGAMPDDAMNVTRKPAMKVGYASEKKPAMVGGRRDFFAYRDLGIGEARAAARCAVRS